MDIYEFTRETIKEAGLSSIIGSGLRRIGRTPGQILRAAKAGARAAPKYQGLTGHASKALGAATGASRAIGQKLIGSGTNASTRAALGAGAVAGLGGIAAGRLAQKYRQSK